MLNSSAPGKGRIVFCDDDRDLLALLGESAQEMGLEVHLADGPLALLFCLDSFRPDVVVTDIDMPHMNGFEMVARLKAAGSNIPFIFLTGHASVENYQRGFVEGHFEFLSKPIEFDALEIAIRKALSFGAQHAPSGRLAELIELAFAPKATG